MSTTAQSIPGEALSLFLGQNKDGQVDSSVPIRWCISRETAEMIQEKGILNPQLVIVIEQDGLELRRDVVPLEKQMHWMQFRRPGENVIRATIMWPQEEGGKPVEKILTKRDDDGKYMVELVITSQPKVEALNDQLEDFENKEYYLEDEDEVAAYRAKRDQLVAAREAIKDSEPKQTHLREGFTSLSRIDYEFQLGVTVPKEMFAKEPPRWMKYLGTKYSYWNGAARDQCDLRRRALITAPTLPFYWSYKAIKALVMVCAVLVVMIGLYAFNLGQIAVLLVAGFRNVSFQPLREPIDVNTKLNVAVDKDLKPSFWWNKKVEHKCPDGDSKYYTYELRHPVLTVLNPPVVLVLVAIGYALYIVLSALLFQFIVIIMAAVFLAVVLIIGLLASDAIADAKAAGAKRKEQEKKEREERQKLALCKDLEQLACSSASHEVSVSALPKERRTVALRFQALKSQVCKPFAR